MSRVCRRRNPRSDSSVMIIGIGGLAALAYWYFVAKPNSVAPATLLAVTPQISTTPAIPTVPASSTLATPVVKPFTLHPPSTLLPSGAYGDVGMTPESPVLGPDGTLHPWQPFAVDLNAQPAIPAGAYVVKSAGEMLPFAFGSVAGHTNVVSVGSGPLRLVATDTYAPAGTVLLDPDGTVQTV